MATRAEAKRGDLYEEDFAAWVERQVGALRALAASGAAPPDLDLAHLIEEVEGLGGSERRGVENRVIVIVGHLLKLEYSPAAEPRRGWRDTVRAQRVQLERDLSLTLRRHLFEVWDGLYPSARNLAVNGMRQDRVASDAVSTSCPYSFDQVTQQEWWPRNRHGHDNP